MNNELTKEEIIDWTVPDKDGNINVPDELIPLFNKVGFQIRFHTISGKNEILTIASIVKAAVEFASQEKKKDAIEFAKWCFKNNYEMQDETFIKDKTAYTSEQVYFIYQQ